MMNEKALEDALTLLFGEDGRVPEMVHLTYRALDAAEARGFIAGAEVHTSGAIAGGGYQAGYEAGLEDGIEVATGGEAVKDRNLTYDDADEDDFAAFDGELDYDADADDWADVKEAGTTRPEPVPYTDKEVNDINLRAIPMWAAVRVLVEEMHDGRFDGLTVEEVTDEFMYDWLSSLNTASDMRP
jgi:hypothetical protein